MRNQTTPTTDAVITTASAVYPFVAANQTATPTIAMGGVYSPPVTADDHDEIEGHHHEPEQRHG